MNLEALMKLAQDKKTNIAARSNFSNLVRPPQGKSKWRILPGWREGEPEVFWHDFGQHYIKDKDGNVKAVLVCPKDTFGLECEICDSLYDMIRSTKDDSTLKLLKELKSRQSHIVNAVRLDGADANPKKPVLLNIPGSVLSEYLTNLANYQKDDDINILDVKEGRAVNIDRTGTGLNTKYSLNVAGKSDAVDPAALASLINIDDYIEGEKVRGATKAGMFDSAARTIMSLSGSSVYVPSSAAKMLSTPSRVIEADVEKAEVTWATSPTAPKTVPATVLSDDEIDNAVVDSTVSKSTVSKADAPVEDEELKRLLAELD